jgi:hypothetical protein
MAADSGAGLAASAVSIQRRDSVSSSGRLVFQRTLGVPGLDPSLARIDRARHRTRATAVVGIHRDHYMRRNTPAHSFADLSGTAPPLRRGAEIDVARILYRRHVPARHGRARPRAPSFDQAVRRHLPVGRKTAKTNFPRAAAFTQSARALALAPDNAFEQ